MSATAKRIFFLLSTAAFTICLNGALAPAKAIDMTQSAIASQKSSLKSQQLALQSKPETTSFSPASAPSNTLEAEPTASIIFTSAAALSPNFDQAAFLAQQQPGTPTQTPRSPDSGVDEYSNPLPDTTDSDGTTTPSDSTTQDQQFDTPTQTPRSPDSGVDEYSNPLPDTTDSDGTSETEVDEFGNPVPDTTGSDDTLDSDDTLEPETQNPGLAPGAIISPGRATRSGPSYIGVGGNIGLGDGDTAVGEGAFAIISKIGLTNYLSLRPSVLFSDDPTFLIPLTFDFIPGVTDVTEDLSGELGLRVSPFIGGGVALSTGDDTDASFLITGGVDVPLQERISANASVNLTLGDETAIGLILGVGYNF